MRLQTLTPLYHRERAAIAGTRGLVKCTAMNAPGVTLQVDTPTALAELCERLAGCEWLALDTEFHREKTYYPQFCLLQLATPELVAWVDPLTVTDLKPLLELLDREEIVKVFHAARQDLEIFYHLTGHVPAPVFDTQVAAPLLGYPDQVGYGALVSAALGVNLSKGHARADWTRRPLPSKQLEYALDDVRYLARLYPHLRDELEQRGRLQWLAEDFAALVDTAQYENPPASAWRRIRGTDRLRSPQLAVLQRLAAWREQSAQQENRPRNWLVRDDALLDIARQIPANRKDLEHIRGLNERVVRRYGDTLLALIAEARTAKPDPLPASGTPIRLDHGQEALVDALTAVVRLRAAEQQLNPSVLASRKDLERLTAGQRDVALLRGWKKALIGEDLCAMIEGNISLEASNGRLAIKRSPN